MTDVILVNTIATEVREMLSDGGLQALYGNVFEDIIVYEHDIPLVQVLLMDIAGWKRKHTKL